MPDLIPHSDDNPDFARVLALRQLREVDSFAFDIAPTVDEAAALTRLLGARTVRKMRLAGTLERLPRGGWRLDATLGATVVQTCVVTLDPVTTRIDQPLHRLFLPRSTPVPVDLEIPPDEDDEVEPLGDTIDLGLVATEALALALPPYPRVPGATFEVAADAGPDEAAPKPFAALEVLRAKLGDGK